MVMVSVAVAVTVAVSLLVLGVRGVWQVAWWARVVAVLLLTEALVGQVVWRGRVSVGPLLVGAVWGPSGRGKLVIGGEAVWWLACMVEVVEVCREALG